MCNVYTGGSKVALRLSLVLRVTITDALNFRGSEVGSSRISAVIDLHVKCVRLTETAISNSA